MQTGTNTGTRAGVSGEQVDEENRETWSGNIGKANQPRTTP